MAAFARLLMASNLYIHGRVAIRDSGRWKIARKLQRDSTSYASSCSQHRESCSMLPPLTQACQKWLSWHRLCFVTQLAWFSDGTGGASIEEMTSITHDEKGASGLRRGNVSSEEYVDVLSRLYDVWSRMTLIVDTKDECLALWEGLVMLVNICTKDRLTMQKFYSFRI